MIIAICGGTCSGKTTVSNELKRMFDKSIAVVSIDNYYKAYPELSFEERRNINYDEPNSINVSKLIEDVKSLDNGRAIVQPFFSFETLLNEESNNITDSAKIIIVEGLFSLFYQELVDMSDLKIYLEADADVRLSRRILRDLKIQNRSLDFILNQYFNFAKPMHKLYVEPLKSRADIIVSGNYIHEKIYELLSRMVSL